MPTVDASSPAVATGLSNVATTASFDPPAAYLVAVTGTDDASGAPHPTVAITNNGTALTWTEKVLRNAGDASAQDGAAACHTAELTSGRSGMTVTATVTNGDGECALKLFVVTAYDTADPVGVTGEGSSTTNDITPTALTAVESSSSLGIVGGNDWNANGAPTSSDLTLSTYHLAGGISGCMGYKTGPAAGNNMPANPNAGGAGAAAWNWVAIEIEPGTAASRPLPPAVVAQALTRAGSW